MTYNAKKKRNRRGMNTSGAVKRLFGNRKRRPCAYCGRVLTAEAATFDHVRPLSAGGYDKTKNGAISCRDCNSRKGSMSVEQFKQKLAGAVSEA